MMKKGRSGSWKELARGFLKPGKVYPQPEETMRRLIRVGVSAVSERRRGSFVAAVATDRGEVVSIAVNQVAEDADSTAHAEMLALRQAQQSLGSVSPGGGPEVGLRLYTTCQPCVMCTGAIHWAGIKKVYAAVRHEDAMRVGIRPDLLGKMRRCSSRVRASTTSGISSGRRRRRSSLPSAEPLKPHLRRPSESLRRDS